MTLQTVRITLVLMALGGHLSAALGLTSGVLVRSVCCCNRQTCDGCLVGEMTHHGADCCRPRGCCDTNPATDMVMPPDCRCRPPLGGESIHVDPSLPAHPSLAPRWVPAPVATLTPADYFAVSPSADPPIPPPRLAIHI